MTITKYIVHDETAMEAYQEGYKDAIERCAQVAENILGPQTDQPPGWDVAAEIRKLKDEI